MLKKTLMICPTCLAFAQGFLQSVGSDILVGLVGGGRTPSSTNAPSGGGGPVPVLLSRHVGYDDRLLLLTVRLARTIFGSCCFSAKEGNDCLKKDVSYKWP